MKDFTKILEGESSSPSPSPQSVKHDQPSAVMMHIRYLARIFTSSAILSFFTSPLIVGSILLQISATSSKSKLQQNLKKINKTEGNPLHLRMLETRADGRARPFGTPLINDYREGYRFLTAGKGLRGFYTGNFYHLIIILVTETFSSLSMLLPNTDPNKNTMILPVLLKTFGEMMANPFACAQSHKVAGLPAKRTFGRSAFLQIPKNLTVMSCWWISLAGRPTETLIICTGLSHVVSYPFMTLIRRYQISRQKGPLLKFIKNQSGLYKGFGAYLCSQAAIALLAISIGPTSML